MRHLPIALLLLRHLPIALLLRRHLPIALLLRRHLPVTLRHLAIARLLLRWPTHALRRHAWLHPLLRRHLPVSSLLRWRHLPVSSLLHLLLHLPSLLHLLLHLLLQLLLRRGTAHAAAAHAAAVHAAHDGARGGGKRGDGGRQQAEHPAEVAERHLGFVSAKAPHAARARAAELVHLLGLGLGVGAMSGVRAGAGASPNARAAERAHLDRRAEGEQPNGRVGWQVSEHLLECRAETLALVSRERAVENEQQRGAGDELRPLRDRILDGRALGLQLRRFA